MTTYQYGTPLLASLKRVARITALWYGSYDDNLLTAVRRYAFTKSDATLAQPFEQLPLCDMLARAIAQLASSEVERTVRLLAEIGKSFTEDDGELYRAFLFAVHSKVNLLQLAPRMLGNDDARYFLAATTLFFARTRYDKEVHESLKGLRQLPWEHYAAINAQRERDIEASLRYLGCESIGVQGKGQNYQKQVATALFGHAWASEYDMDDITPLDIIRDVLMARPPF